MALQSPGRLAWFLRGLVFWPGLVWDNQSMSTGWTLPLSTPPPDPASQSGRNTFGVVEMKVGWGKPGRPGLFFGGLAWFSSGLAWFSRGLVFGGLVF